MAVLCPFSGAPLRLKQLYPVCFTPAKDEDEAAAAGGSIDGLHANERYICPLSKKGLTNAVACAVLRPSGQVVTMECVLQIIKRDMLDPFCSPPAALAEKDIIPIRTEGTGFAARGSTEVKKLGAQVRRPRARLHSHFSSRASRVSHAGGQPGGPSPIAIRPSRPRVHALWHAPGSARAAHLTHAQFVRPTLSCARPRTEEMPGTPRMRSVRVLPNSQSSSGLFGLHAPKGMSRCLYVYSCISGVTGALGENVLRVGVALRGRQPPQPYRLSPRGPAKCPPRR
jgi:hypothetical protein